MISPNILLCKHRKYTIVILLICTVFVITLGNEVFVASAEIPVTIVQQEELAHQESQACVYSAPIRNRTVESNLPLDVMIFIDESDTARGIDPALPDNEDTPFRYQMLQLIANFLLMDSEIRGVENRLSVWVYASDTVYVGGEELDKWKQVNAATIADLESIQSYALTSRSYVDFGKLFDTVRDRVLSARNESLPVVLLINDPFPNGRSDQRELDFADIARQSWLEIEKPNKTSFYMLDFTAGATQSFAQREAVRAKWLSEFFTEGIHGHLLPITEYNKLTIVARMIEEVIEQSMFFPLTGNPPQLHVPPLADSVTFGFVYNEEVLDSARWTPTSNTGRASIKSDHRYIRIYEAENPSRTWRLPQNRLDRSVMYTFRSVGGLEQMEVFANPTSYAHQYFTVRARFSSDGNINPVLRWGTDESNYTVGRKIKDDQEAVTYLWRIGPVRQIDQPMELKILLESSGKIPFICSFPILPVPELKMHLESIEPLKLKIAVSHMRYLPDPLPNPEVYILPLGEGGLRTRLEVVPSDHISTTAIYAATHQIPLDSHHSRTIIAELNIEHGDGSPISLRDTITILSRTLVVTETQEFISTPYPDLPPAPEPFVPPEALKILGVGTIILAIIIFTITLTASRASNH